MKLKYIALAIVIACSGCGEIDESKAEQNGFIESHISDENREIKEEVRQEKRQDKPQGMPQDEAEQQPQSSSETQRMDEGTNPNLLRKESATPRGHCDTEQNRAHFFAHNHEFAENLFMCVDQGWTTADLDVNRMAQKYPEIAKECLYCFETYTKCTADNCKRHCRPTWTGGPGERSTPCKKCAWKYCGDAMEKCTGLPRASLPDFKR